MIFNGSLKGHITREEVPLNLHLQMKDLIFYLNNNNNKKISPTCFLLSFTTRLYLVCRMDPLLNCIIFRKYNGLIFFFNQRRWKAWAIELGFEGQYSSRCCEGLGVSSRWCKTKLKTLNWNMEKLLFFLLYISLTLFLGM